MIRAITWAKEHILETIFFTSVLGLLLVPLGAVIHNWQVVMAGIAFYCIVAGIGAWAYLPDKSIKFKILGCAMVAAVGWGVYASIELVSIYC